MGRIHVDGFTVESVLSISILNKVPAQYHTSLEIKTSSGSESHSIMCDGPPGQSNTWNKAYGETIKAENFQFPWKMDLHLAGDRAERGPNNRVYTKGKSPPPPNSLPQSNWKQHPHPNRGWPFSLEPPKPQRTSYVNKHFSSLQTV